MEERLLLDVNECAGLLGVKRTKIYELMNAGEIASVHIGRLRKVSRQAVQDYVGRLTAEQVTSA